MSTVQTVTRTEALENEIRALLDAYMEALNDRDADRMDSFLARGMTAFDFMAPLRTAGANAYRRQWEPCLEACPPSMTFSVRDLVVTAGEEVAFSHHLHCCSGAMPDGEGKEYWTRMTVGYTKADGIWKMAHVHLSSPYDIESGQALVSLAP
jgi:ketosteroid isomerase-like protein